MSACAQILVADEAALERCAQVIAAAPRVALDTESNGFHAYFEKVCLVQLACDEAEFAVDTKAVALGPLLPLLADPTRELVLHAAEFDVLTLRRDYGLRLGRLFDTHAAAKALGLPRVGLGDLLQDQLGVTLAGDEQRSDWGHRPLSASQLAYAFADVSHLLALRERLDGQLHARGLRAEAEAEFERVRLKEPRLRPFDPEGWQRMKAARTLDGRGRAALRALYLVRDARARDLDRPAFKVMSELFLAEVARRLPATEAQLAQIPGISAVQLRKVASQVLAAVAESLAGPPPERPRQQARQGPPWRRDPGRDPEVEARYQALRGWRKARAEARQVEVQVIAPNAVLLAVARAAPGGREELGRVEGMDAFRLEQYGDEILGALPAPKAGSGAAAVALAEAPTAAAPEAPAAAKAAAARPAQEKLFE